MAGRSRGSSPEPIDLDNCRPWSPKPIPPPHAGGGHSTVPECYAHFRPRGSRDASSPFSGAKRGQGVEGAVSAFKEWAPWRALWCGHQGTAVGPAELALSCGIRVCLEGLRAGTESSSGSDSRPSSRPSSGPAACAAPSSSARNTSTDAGSAAPHGAMAPAVPRNPHPALLRLVLPLQLPLLLGAWMESGWGQTPPTPEDEELETVMYVRLLRSSLMVEVPQEALDQSLLRFRRLHLDFPRRSSPGRGSEYCTGLMAWRGVAGPGGSCPPRNTFIHAPLEAVRSVRLAPNISCGPEREARCYQSLPLATTECQLATGTTPPNCQYFSVSIAKKVVLAQLPGSLQGWLVPIFYQ
ncbi:probable ribonuclease 11 [Tachyglossus aculeatus]|uniref:probable ribonuclease 11 n=1 Tax=Tachyglossus aculeatus TaxID=9261 RepID=UPI0018F6E0B0|nr:probable ribonuclease 11 [Tachyglossus aculeatus]